MSSTLPSPLLFGVTFSKRAVTQGEAYGNAAVLLDFPI